MSDPTDAMALLKSFHAHGGERTFRVKPDGAELFGLLHELKAAGLIEELPCFGVLNYRYRLTEQGKAEL